MRSSARPWNGYRGLFAFERWPRSHLGIGSSSLAARGARGFQAGTACSSHAAVAFWSARERTSACERGSVRTRPRSALDRVQRLVADPEAFGAFVGTEDREPYLLVVAAVTAGAEVAQGVALRLGVVTVRISNRRGTSRDVTRPLPAGRWSRPVPSRSLSQRAVPARPGRRGRARAACRSRGAPGHAPRHPGRIRGRGARRATPPYRSSGCGTDRGGSAHHLRLHVAPLQYLQEARLIFQGDRFPVFGHRLPFGVRGQSSLLLFRHRIDVC